MHIHCFTGGLNSIVLDGAALRWILAYQDQVCQCWGSRPWMGSIGWDTLMPAKVEHIEMKEHLIIITSKLIIEHLSYTLSIASNGRIPGCFHCINSQPRLTIRDARLCGWAVPGHQLPLWYCDWLLHCVNGDVYTVLINFNLCRLTAIPVWKRDSNIYSNQNKNVSPSLMHLSNVSFASNEDYHHHYSVNNIPYQCDINCAGNFTLDALASRLVPIIGTIFQHISDSRR